MTCITEQKSGRLDLELPNAQTLLLLRSRYFDNGPFAEVLIEDAPMAALIKLADLAGGTPSSWAARLLVANLYGRYLSEQAAPLVSQRLRRQAGAPEFGSYISIPEILVRDLSVVAVQTGTTARSVINETLIHELFGICHYPAAPVDHAGWQFCDALLTVWTPETLHQKIKVLSHHYESSVGDVIRNSLLIALYGRLEYQKAVGQGFWKPTRRPSAPPEIMFSRPESAQPVSLAIATEQGVKPVAPRSARVERYGKSNVSIKIELPLVLKEQLKSQANQRKVRLSDFSRAILIRKISGHYGASE